MPEADTRKFPRLEAGLVLLGVLLALEAVVSLAFEGVIAYVAAGVVGFVGVAVGLPLVIADIREPRETPSPYAF